MQMPQLSLGFVEKAPSWTLVSHLFPDKVGGRPAWLALTHLPAPIECPRCVQPMVFLLQVYSSLEEEPKREDCFHRTLFVFMCKNGKCFEPTEGVSAVPFRVFRSQLSRENPYYSSEPPIDVEKITQEAIIQAFRSNNVPVAGTISNLCPVCGCVGSKSCAQCQKAYYCSKEHQTIHWKQGHKSSCPEYDCVDEMFKKNTFLLPEFHLYSETFDENDINNDVDIKEDCSDEESDAEQVGVRDLSSEEKAEFSALEEVSRKETKEERAFAHFKEVLKRQPDQVVRFSRGGKPLWASIIPLKPPPCPRCEGKRIFEFQITPQLLSHLKLDKVGESSPDFATVYIFTCENSCPLALSGSIGYSPFETYVEEFIAFDRVP